MSWVDHMSDEADDVMWVQAVSSFCDDATSEFRLLSEVINLPGALDCVLQFLFTCLKNRENLCCGHLFVLPFPQLFFWW